LLHDKKKAVSDFFTWIGKAVHEITPSDVKSWQFELERRNLAPTTIYAMISRISSFYEWLLKSPEMAGWVARNPVSLSRMKPPKPYSSDSTKSLSDDEIRELIQVVKARTDVIGLRDYALLMFYILTGMRRAEVANLTWGDVNIDERDK
jgi:site-specific recombinase XerD